MVYSMAQAHKNELQRCECDLVSYCEKDISGYWALGLIIRLKGSYIKLRVKRRPRL